MQRSKLKFAKEEVYGVTPICGEEVFLRKSSVPIQEKCKTYSKFIAQVEYKGKDYSFTVEGEPFTTKQEVEAVCEELLKYLKKDEA